MTDAAASGHSPVLLPEVITYLAPRVDAVVLDGTFGGGGYAQAILDRGSSVWAIDRDPQAIARGAAMVAAHPARLHLVHGGFGDLLALLTAHGVDRLDGAVFDLGVSSFQLDDPARGFSFRADGPLDMRMDASGPSAADLVNTLPEGELADVLYQFGEERLSRRIARAIVAARQQQRFDTTLQLASVIRRVVPMDKSGIDPATRSFQALRIRVNDELGHLRRALEQASRLLANGGRLVVVSFHSLEDRIVKQFMAGLCGRGGAVSRHGPAALTAAPVAQFRLLTNRACRPSDEECRRNPRARSARLRAVERLASAGVATADTVASGDKKDFRFSGAKARFRTGETDAIQREENALRQELAA